MKNRMLIFLFVLLAGISTGDAQTYTGYLYNNYETVAGAVFNPANIANSRYWFDFNLISANATGGSNAFNIDRKSFFKFKFDDWEENTEYSKINNGNTKRFWGNTDIIGPSVMVNINQKNAFAITSRLRFIGIGRNLDNDVFQLLGKTNDPSLFNKDYNLEDVRGNLHGFADFGLTYATVLSQSKTHVLKAGLTAKYVVGVAGGSGYSNKMVINKQDEDNFNKIDGDITLLYSSGIDKVVDDNDDNLKWRDVTNNRGFGFDVGMVYEWRPEGIFDINTTNEESHWLERSRTNYRLRAALSVTDIGSIKYDLAKNARSYTINSTNIPASEFDIQDGETFDDYIERLKGSILKEAALPSKYKVSLPTVLHANLDWNVYKHLFVNTSAAINLLGKNSNGANYITSFSVTPRYEGRWLGVYSPVSVNTTGQVDWGFGLNFGMLYVGSGTIISNLLSTNMKAANAYAGLHIPIYKSRPKKAAPVVLPVAPPPVVSDRDGDGIPDDEDECPDVPGVAKYKGCPVPDRDGDGIPDDEDKCPDVPGVARYNGCPIPDRDGDGINDEEDECPDVPGVARYKGCPVPDRDGDGVNDEEDRCPDVPGTVENHGCPEIKQEIVQRVNYSAKKIQFATGSDKLLKQSLAPLDDIVKILEEQPEVLLQIDGHTDITGNPTSNQTLSEKRAASVKNYLISKGATPDRISTAGYGDTQPVDSNKTTAGRANNRRVELKLHY